MAIRRTTLAVLLVLSAVGRADNAPPPAPSKENFTASVSALNTMFKKDPAGAVAKRFTGRVVTVSGTVKEVIAADDGSQTLGLNGLQHAAEDPAGCTIPFPANHKSLKLVKALQTGANVRVRGEIDGVNGMTFTLKNPVLLTVAAADAKGSVAATPKPQPPAPAPAKPQPPAPPVVAKPDLTKSTAAAFTEAMLIDRTRTIAQKLTGQTIELTGVVRSNVRSTDGRA
ncbi:MAG: OB-fold protein, partial [Fimbriiglobus sp.]